MESSFGGAYSTADLISLQLPRLQPKQSLEFRKRVNPSLSFCYQINRKFLQGNNKSSISMDADSYQRRSPPNEEWKQERRRRPRSNRPRASVRSLETTDSTISTTASSLNSSVGSTLSNGDDSSSIRRRSNRPRASVRSLESTEESTISTTSSLSSSVGSSTLPNGDDSSSITSTCSGCCSVDATHCNSGLSHGRSTSTSTSTTSRSSRRLQELRDLCEWQKKNRENNITRHLSLPDHNTHENNNDDNNREKKEVDDSNAYCNLRRVISKQRSQTKNPLEDKEWKEILMNAKIQQLKARRKRVQEKENERKATKQQVISSSDCDSSIMISSNNTQTASICYSSEPTTISVCGEGQAKFLEDVMNSNSNNNHRQDNNKMTHHQNKMTTLPTSQDQAKFLEHVMNNNNRKNHKMAYHQNNKTTLPSEGQAKILEDAMNKKNNNRNHLQNNKMTLPSNLPYFGARIGTFLRRSNNLQQ